MTLVARQALLHLTDVQQSIPLHQPAQLPHERDVSGDVPAELAELWVLFDEALHVSDGSDGGRVVVGRFGLEVRDVGGEGRAEVAEV
jgi:hypothetical protein